MVVCLTENHDFNSHDIAGLYKITGAVVFIESQGQFSTAVFSRKVVLRNFAKFTGKHLHQSLFFKKVAGLRLATLLKKRLCYRYFLRILRNG